MSWDAGQLYKRTQASWWEGLITAPRPRFKTQTHKHKEVDQVYAMRSEGCVGRRGWRENTRPSLRKETSLFSWIHIVVQKWPQAGHMSVIWATGGKTDLTVVSRRMIQQWCQDKRRGDTMLGLMFEYDQELKTLFSFQAFFHKQIFALRLSLLKVWTSSFLFLKGNLFKFAVNKNNPVKTVPAN